MSLLQEIREDNGTPEFIDTPLECERTEYNSMVKTNVPYNITSAPQKGYFFNTGSNKKYSGSRHATYAVI